MTGRIQVIIDSTHNHQLSLQTDDSDVFSDTCRCSRFSYSIVFRKVTQ